MTAWAGPLWRRDWGRHGWQAVEPEDTWDTSPQGAPSITIPSCCLVRLLVCLPVGPVSQLALLRVRQHAKTQRGLAGSGWAWTERRLSDDLVWRLTSTNVLCHAASPHASCWGCKSSDLLLILLTLGSSLPFPLCPFNAIARSVQNCSCSPPRRRCLSSPLRFASAPGLPPSHLSLSPSDATVCGHYWLFCWSFFPPTHWLLTPSCSFLSSLIGAHL